MKRVLSLGILFLLGSCAIPKTDMPIKANQARTSVADIFNECDTLAAKAYPVIKRTSLRGKPMPTVLCKLTDSMRCDEHTIQAVAEFDMNDASRRIYTMECIRLKLDSLPPA